jgi:hypothetical protein
VISSLHIRALRWVIKHSNGIPDYIHRGSGWAQVAAFRLGLSQTLEIGTWVCFELKMLKIGHDIPKSCKRKI